MIKKVLLLNSTFEILSIIEERKALRLIVKDKVDVVASWNDIKIRAASGQEFEYPAIIKLKYFIYKKFTKVPFSRIAVFRRDKYTCQFCGKKCGSGHITLDHLIPKSQGGKSNFTNCVASCMPCNTKKRNRTPEQAGMALLSEPVRPNEFVYYLPDEDQWHSEWKKYFK